MSIPKKIHYCWFGGKPLPPLAEKCLKSWKKYCPDYEIVRWDESNFDFSKYPYAQEAYEAKKWAFVTDIVRLIVIYEHGGIYLDTDVELIRPLDALLCNQAYFGFEGNTVNTGLGFGAEPGNPIVKSLAESYQGVHFRLPDGTFDTTTCPARNTAALKKIGLVDDGSYQTIDGVVFLPKDYLCPLDYETRKLTITANTVSIHRFAATWYPWYDRFEQFLKPVVGDRAANKTKRILMTITGHKY